MVESACRAPSLHNSQPWRWMFGGGVLHLFADHRGLVTTPTSPARKSCPAALLDHLRVASAGLASHHRQISRSARSRPSGVGLTGQRLRVSTELGNAIPRRHTDRLAFAAPEPWVELEQQLRAVHGTVVDLDVIDDNGRPALADASRRSEQPPPDDASYQYELLWWTGGSRVGDGIPASALPSSAEAHRVDVAREFPVYSGGDRSASIGPLEIIVLSTSMTAGRTP